MDRRNGSSDPLRFSFGETRGGSATGDRSGRRGPFGLPARRRRALCMTTVRAFGWPLWNGMCIVTARRGRLPGLSWMRSDEPILFRVSGFCLAAFAVRSGRAGFGRTAGRTGPDSERAIARHSFAPVRARDEKPCSRRSRPGGCADRSQPKIHPCSSPSSPSPRSMVRREMQREASILRPGRMAPAGHASMQRWQFPQPSGTAGRPASSSAVVTISPSSTNDPRRGWIRSEFRPIQPSPASAAHAFSTIGAVSVKARPSESGYSSRTRTSSSASFSRSVR